MCSDAGLKVHQVAQALQVTERTVYAWFSGKTAVPYAAYKLLRILNRFELPGWPGWHMHSGKLWTPEGFGFDPTDGSWWSLLVRQARGFRGQYERANRLERVMRSGAEAGKPATHAEGQGASEVASAASGLVSVSTSGAGDAERSDFDITGDINLTSFGVRDVRYQFDHGMTSCPTLFAYRLNSMKPLGSAVSASASASTR